jgi:methylated-DNA-[protein]-cysteine S-methyltransferase
MYKIRTGVCSIQVKFKGTRLFSLNVGDLLTGSGVDNLDHKDVGKVFWIEGEVDNQMRSMVNKLGESLSRYFDGFQPEFNVPIDWTGYTYFQRSVLEAVREIPYGETRSYKQIAQQIGNDHACRAVGQALAANRCLLIVPCHRVIGAQGTLGGFSDGLDKKKWLLDLERRSK